MLILVSLQPLLFWVPAAVSVVVLIWALFVSPWRQLFAIPVRQHLYWGSVLALAIFWQLVGVNVNELYVLHLMILASSVLIFGPSLSLILGAIALVIIHWMQGIYWHNIAFHFVCSVLTPVVVTHTLLLAIKKIRVQNLFIFTLGGGFIGGMLSMLASGGVALALLWLFDSTMFWPVSDNAILFFLLTFPEGFCNGVLVSGFTVFRPEWVKNYDDDFYLKEK